MNDAKTLKELIDATKAMNAAWVKVLKRAQDSKKKAA